MRTSTPPSSDPQNKKYVTLIATMRLLQFFALFHSGGNGSLISLFDTIYNTWSYDEYYNCLYFN